MKRTAIKYLMWLGIIVAGVGAFSMWYKVLNADPPSVEISMLEQFDERPDRIRIKREGPQGKTLVVEGDFVEGDNRITTQEERVFLKNFLPTTLYQVADVSRNNKGGLLVSTEIASETLVVATFMTVVLVVLIFMERDRSTPPRHESGDTSTGNGAYA